MKAAELLERALAAPADSPARALLVTAAVSAAAGVEYVLVGGSAVNLYTGAYRPTDLDLVGPAGKDLDRALLGLGFNRRGRYLVLKAAEEEVALDIPDDRLFDLAGDPPERIEVAPGVSAAVLSGTDLMMDRLLQATDGTAVTTEEAVLLAVGAYERIDWVRLEARAAAAAAEGRRSYALLPATLRRVRSRAKKALRSQERPEAPPGTP